MDFNLIWHSTIFVLSCMALFYLAFWLFKLFNPKIPIRRELTVTDNLAFYCAYIGYFGALILVVSGVMHSESTANFWMEILYTLIYGAIAILALNLFAIYTDKVIFPKARMWDEIVGKKKVSIGVMKGANFISAGIIVGGVLLTEVEHPYTAVFFLIFAMLISSVGFFYYNFITPFNSRTEIENGNTAVAIASGGAQIAFAILIYAGFQLEHSDWSASLLHILIDLLIGFAMLPFVRWVIDKIFLVDRNLNQELTEQKSSNIGAGLFEASAYVGSSLIVIWCWSL